MVPCHATYRAFGASYKYGDSKRCNLPVRGMTCGNCARSVERKLASTPGVTKATVDLSGAQRHRGVRRRPGEARSAGATPCATWATKCRHESIAAAERVDLPVTGMTCAACARAIERTLARHSGRGARQREPGHQHRHRGVRSRTRTGVGDFVGAIEDLGYGVPAERAAAGAAEMRVPPAPARGGDLSRVPVMVLGMMHTRAVGATGAHAAGDRSTPARHFTRRRGARCATAPPT